MPFHTVLQLGPRQSMTPDGFLLCEAVPIARTGEQIYSVGEIPLEVEPGVDGLIRVIRAESEVFRPETIASFEGKPATLDHPAEGVTPENAKKLTVGHAQNVRRGEGADADLLIADLLITDADAIKAIRIDRDPVTGIPVKPLREVSCGYDAEYAQDTPGIAYQRNIVGNHIALVARGRAGSRCSIQDKEPEIMNVKTKDAGLLARLLGRVVAAVKTKDSAQIDAAVADAETAETDEEKAAREKQAQDAAAAAAQAVPGAQGGDRVDKLQASVDALTALVEKLAGGTANATEETPEQKAAREAEEQAAAQADADKQAQDAATVAKVADAHRDLVTRAEILVPGFAVPTVDSMKTLDDVAAVQRQVLAEVIKTEDGKKLVAPFMVGKTVDAMSGEIAALAFVGASEVAREKNNGQRAPSARTADAKSFGKAPTPADINKANADFWSKRQS